MRKSLVSLLAFSVLALPLAGQSTQSGQANDNPQLHPPGTTRSGVDLGKIEHEVRHELVMLPNMSLFDNLAFQVAGDGTVTLLGQVRSPNLKSEAEKAAKSVESVERVENQIQVLPASPNDDRIRIDVARAIFNQPSLFPYSVQSIPPIHIIVSGGNVSLEGLVNSEGDKNIAGIQAKSVPGVFAVTNNLKVENK